MSSAPSVNGFDFQAWTDLANYDPAEFEAQRRLAVDRLIDACGGGQRLRGMQFRIDLERRRARTPLKACLTLYGMMWDSLLAMNVQVRAADATARGAPPAAGRAAADAQVIPFRRV